MIIAKYYVESKLPLHIAGKRICEEVSTGTWTELTTTTKRIERRYSAKVLNINRKDKIVEIGIPLADFEPRNIPQLLSIVAGNVFGLKEIRNLRLLDIKLPKVYVEQFKGPKFGIRGIRKIVKEKKAPLVGCILKPKIGLTPKQTAEVAYDSAVGGSNIIKMDETLTNQRFCPLEENVTKVMEKLDLVKQETGRTVLYAANITTRPDKLLEVADRVLGHGANCLMIDIMCSGLASIQILREDPSIKVPIYCHRAGHAAVTRIRRHGIRWLVFAKLSRLLGADILHSGTIVGKMYGEKREVLEDYAALRDKWFGFKPTLPAASGGLHPGLIPSLVKYLGSDLVMNFGGGVWGHPLGGKAGIRAVRQAVDAIMQKIDLSAYAKYHKELHAALKKWR